MERNLEAAIDVVEAAYDLEIGAAEWLPNLIAAGEPLFDMGMGCFGTIAAGRSVGGVPLLTQIEASRGAEELPTRIIEATMEAGPEPVVKASRAVQGKMHLLSDLPDLWGDSYEAIKRRVGCQDILSMTAVDPDGHGVHIGIPSKSALSLDRRQREYWQMLHVHLATGHRLRRGLGQEGDATGVPLTDIPLAGEALIDPTRFMVAHATGEAQHRGAANAMREAARMLDKARGPLRRKDPNEALRLWKGLVLGKWTLVDWFDSDGRRFVLAKQNAPRIKDPRGLTEREAQVATYAALGETSKIIGYRLGLSASYVSRLLQTSMRKLGVKTQAQLVEKMRWVQSARPPAA
ncbi:MAG: helix-turn-helix transcriptional regulator [Polyangiales bacterium]|jgi:DNA-binding CsgD family transcriptional regulator